MTAYFNPRSPHGERLRGADLRGVQHIISIHALLTESDFVNQSGIEAEIISIHALLTESDYCYDFQGPVTTISIHALLTESDISARASTRSFPDFNPRSPHGERQAVRR